MAGVARTMHHVGQQMLRRNKNHAASGWPFDFRRARPRIDIVTLARRDSIRTRTVPPTKVAHRPRRSGPSSVTDCN
ncbi:hypothetical protein G3N57_22385 [Paraburkholderia sp. Se-20369]|nr:hypothetical protein [Paraburkholderia sp. Se-20369]